MDEVDLLGLGGGGGGMDEVDLLGVGKEVEEQDGARGAGGGGGGGGEAVAHVWGAAETCVSPPACRMPQQEETDAARQGSGSCPAPPNLIDF